MINREKIDRINELAKKSKTIGLSRAEKNEQLSLRQEYITAVRQSFKSNLEQIRFVD